MAPVKEPKEESTIEDPLARETVAVQEALYFCTSVRCEFDKSVRGGERARDKEEFVQ
jgi:hypothetical protein